MNMRHALLLTGLLASLGGLGACADDLNQVIVIGNQAPDQMCEFVPDDTVFIGHGTFEIADLGQPESSTTYNLHPLFRSLMGQSQSGTDKIAILSGANIEVSAVNSDESRAVVAALSSAGLNKAQRRFSAALTPGGDAVVGFAGLDGTQAAALRAVIAPGESAEVLLNVRAFGDTDGNSLESSSWAYPVTICNQCQLRTLGPCNLIPAGTSGEAGLCGQTFTDGVIECCDNDDGVTSTCPAFGTMADGS
jgi:hypothetical protein